MANYDINVPFQCTTCDSDELSRKPLANRIYSSDIDSMGAYVQSYSQATIFGVGQWRNSRGNNRINGAVVAAHCNTGGVTEHHCDSWILDCDFYFFFASIRIIPSSRPMLELLVSEYVQLCSKV